MADCKRCRYYWQGKHDDEPRCYFREWDMRLEYPCKERSDEEKYIEKIQKGDDNED